MGRQKVWDRLAVLSIVSIGLFSALLLSKPAGASLAGFNPGNIMSDYVMSNKNTMTEEQIQSFLKSKNSCNDTDRAKYERYTAQGYKYNWRDGHFVCMADESWGGESAAHIIWKVAQEYSINPQVLIVLLEKEQSLVTDTWPNSRQYDIAVGYACPDNAPCDPERYGFENQLRWAAALFREVLDGSLRLNNYPAYNTVYVQYNANKACGGTNLYIENRATSALYRYTPYQPNAYAMGGGNDSTYPNCGAFGNRNFYDYFTDWFGGTIGGDYDMYKYWQSIGAEQSVVGVPTDSVTCNLVQEGCRQPYERGYIYWSKSSGAWDVSGGMLQRWGALGSEWGALGYPVNTEMRGLSGGGSYQPFQKGYIYWTEKTGAWDISGGIHAKWFEQGTEWGALGYPTSSEKVNERGETYQEFENGRIYWTAGSEAWAVSSRILEQWEMLGGSKSTIIGRPTSNEHCGLVKGGCYQPFQKGYIYWTEKTGAWDISGGIHAKWFEQGTEWGALGYPTSSEKVNERGETYQEFENGRIYWKAGVGSWVVLL